MTSPESSAGGVEAIRFAEGGLQLLDQRLLPLEARWLDIPNAAAAAQAIHEMVVRGAPAIGITAAYGLALAALQGEDREAAAERLAASRPTAVNLHWALARMQGLGAQASPERLLEEARTIHAEDLAQNLRMAEEGVRLIGEGARVLTHCNTGALAAGGHGTALGVIRSAWRAGRLQAVYHTETRPWLQGARLTAWELASEGIPATMIADAACAQLMAEGQVDWV
ncbi:MAG: S-methyl-5-thioribose-1-phosphate isomerase, partial [Algiphilus sp.]|uniref:S-methyl-5-thioribose-1-phosphate isomerase n=1 Tax=Algiphilus sp. TaxID=1872431 RepID=UPI0025B90186